MGCLVQSMFVGYRRGGCARDGDRLPATDFMRVHKSFIVALPYITIIEGNSISLKGNDYTILVGDAYREKFMETMRKKLLGR